MRGTTVYKPAPFSHQLARWLRFFFRRRVTKVSSPEDLGLGLRQVLVLECGHSFHAKPKAHYWSQMGCAACAHEWVKRQKWMN